MTDFSLKDANIKTSVFEGDGGFVSLEYTGLSRSEANSLNEILSMQLSKAGLQHTSSYNDPFNPMFRGRKLTGGLKEHLPPSVILPTIENFLADFTKAAAEKGFEEAVKLYEPQLEKPPVRGIAPRTSQTAGKDLFREEFEKQIHFAGAPAQDRDFALRMYDNTVEALGKPRETRR